MTTQAEPGDIDRSDDRSFCNRPTGVNKPYATGFGCAFADCYVSCMGALEDAPGLFGIGDQVDFLQHRAVAPSALEIRRQQNGGIPDDTLALPNPTKLLSKEYV